MYLRFWNPRFDKEAISDSCRSENVRYRCQVFLKILSDFKDLSFCDSCGLLFLSNQVIEAKLYTEIIVLVLLCIYTCVCVCVCVCECVCVVLRLQNKGI